MRFVGCGVDRENHAFATMCLLPAIEPCRETVSRLFYHSNTVEEIGQNLQRGVSTVIWILKDGDGTTVLLGLGMNIESMPPAILMQGVVKPDCVTVWFVDMKLNCTISPFLAMMVLGE